jgi:hypothetical protein
MFLNPWSLALSLCSLVVLVLGAVAGKTAVRVLRFWEPGSDSNRQIRLENEIWLSSTLVAYGLGFQIVTLILFVLAADEFCQIIVGAMCATGALLANPYGMPALLIKLFGVFFYGFWILLHQLDIRSEHYPLVRIKYLALLLLLPMLALDATLQTLYIAGIKPDIITSCCAVVFAEAGPDSGNLIGIVPQGTMLAAYYGGILGLALIGAWLVKGGRHPFLTGLYSLGWAAFLFLALLAITAVISCYIYALPNHRCPFCIIKPEYYYIGLAIYTTLIGGAFFGLSTGVAALLGRNPELAGPAGRYRRAAVKISLAFLALFALLTSYHYLRYMITGGE